MGFEGRSTHTRVRQQRSAVLVYREVLMQSFDLFGRLDELVTLIDENRVEDISRLFERVPELATERDQHGDSPLHHAVRLGREKIVLLLLSHNVPLDVRDGRGFTALHSAVQIADVGIVQLLLDHGADPNEELPGGASVLAVAEDHTDEGRAVFTALLNGGADFDLYLAVAHGQPTLVAAILQYIPAAVQRFPYSDRLLDMACRLFTRDAKLPVSEQAKICRVSVARPRL